MDEILFVREGIDFVTQIGEKRYYDTPTLTGGPAPFLCYSFFATFRGKIVRVRTENVINLKQLKWAICDYFSLPLERGQLWFDGRVCPRLDLYKFSLASNKKNYIILVDLLKEFTREQSEGVITSLFKTMVEQNNGIPYIEMGNYNVGDKEFTLSLKPLPKRGMPDVTRFKVLENYYRLFFPEDSPELTREFLCKLIEEFAADRPFFKSALKKDYPVVQQTRENMEKQLEEQPIKPAKKKTKLTHEDHLLLVQQTRENMEKQLEEFKKEQSRRSGKIVHSDHASVNIKLL